MNYRNARASRVLFAVAVVVGACSDMPPLEPIALVEQEPALFRGPVRPASQFPGGLDAEFVRIAREVPGFGGTFYDADGRLNVYMTAAAGTLSASSTRDVLGAQLSRLGIAAAELRGATVHLGNYDFVQLDAMHRRIAPVLALAGVVFTDVDESRNRLRIGVEDRAAARNVAHTLQMMGIPSDAAVTELTEPLTPDATLRERVRPVAGGLQIWRFIPPTSASICTLGFNVRSPNAPNVQGFVTNSHCTEQRSVVTGTLFNQKELALPVETIGTEVHDIPFFTGGPCPEGRRCRFSDAAGVLYQPGVDNAFGRIYRTLFPGTTADGSLEIDAANSQWQIVAEQPWPLIGEVIHKTGRTTGWTMGPVVGTCVLTNVAGSDITLLCQDLGELRSAGGDSGSPYFIRVGESSEVRLVGIHWGSGTGITALSSMENIRFENQGPAPWITFPGQTPPPAP